MGSLVESQIRAAISRPPRPRRRRGPRRDQGRCRGQRAAAQGHGDDHRGHRDAVAGRPRPAVPPDARPRRLRARADGRPRRIGREAGPQARPRTAAQAVRRPPGARAASGDAGQRRHPCARRRRRRSGPARSPRWTTRSTASTTGSSTTSSALMREDPGNVDRGDPDPVRRPLSRADRRSGHEHRRGHRVPRVGRGRRPQPVTGRRRTIRP